MTQGYNLSGYQQMLADTAPKTDAYLADKVARTLTGGKDYMPRTIVKTGPSVTPSFSPIKGLGGAVGAGMALLPTWSNFTKGIWNGMNLNTMDPVIRDKYARGYMDTMKMFGKDVSGEVAKYLINEVDKKNAPANMPVVARDVYNLLSGNKEETVSQSPSNNTQPGKQSTQRTANELARQISRQATGQVTGQAAPAGTEVTTEDAQDISPERAQIINDYISRLQEANRPYADALSGYYNNYDDMLDKARRAQRYWQGIASVTGNPNWARISNSYNPLKTEAEKISMVKQMQDAQLGNVNAVNEMMGNLALAEELGLPPEAAFGNKNLLTALSMQNRDEVKLKIAIANNLMKKYGIDKNYARALAQQALRNQGSLAVANTYMGGGAGGVAPGLNAQGGAQTSYKSPVNNQDPRAQFFK